MAQPERLVSTDQRENSVWLDRYREVLTPGQRVLDLGCGTGDDALELISFGCAVTALDLQIDRVRKVPSQSGVHLRVVADLAGGLPFSSSTFDVVSASLSLHYFSAGVTHAATAEVSRVLQPAGWLLCRVNAAGDVNFGYGRGAEIEPGLFLQPEGNLKRFFDPQMLEHFLRACFTVKKIVPRTILQNGREKRTLECLARKR